MFIKKMKVLNGSDKSETEVYYKILIKLLWYLINYYNKKFIVSHFNNKFYFILIIMLLSARDLRKSISN